MASEMRWVGDPHEGTLDLLGAGDRLCGFIAHVHGEWRAAVISPGLAASYGAIHSTEPAARAWVEAEVRRLPSVPSGSGCGEG